MSETTEFDRLMAETYTPHIIRSVRRCLSPKIRQKLDSQDVAQTLWAALLRRRTDLLRFKTREQLIAYLVQATKNKVAEKAVKLRRKKYDINREEPLDALTALPKNNRAQPTRELHSRDPTPSMDASVRERWQLVMSNASERDRQILQLVIQRHTYLEISELLSIHEQTARRAVEKLVKELSD